MQRKKISVKNLLIVSFFIGIIGFYGYNIDKEGKVKSLSISTMDFKQSGKVSDFLSFGSIIPLETDDICLINSIDKIKTSKTNIFVFDFRSQKLLQFNDKGEFLRQIGKTGKGPGEYLEIMDFEIDPINEIIYLLDVRKIHQFSYSGDFIRTFRTDFFASKIYLSPDKEFFFYGAARENRLFITTSDFKLKEKYFPYSIAYDLDSDYPFSNYMSNTVFHLPTNDTLYDVVNGKPVASLYINFNGKNFTSHDYNKLSDSDKNRLFEFQLKSSKYVRCLGFLPIQDYVFMSLNYSNDSYWGIYNLNNEKHEFVKMKNLENDIFGSFMYFHPKGVTETEFIFAVSPNKLIKDKTSPFYLSNLQDLEGLTDYSNPVLVFARPIL